MGISPGVSTTFATDHGHGASLHVDDTVPILVPGRGESMEEVKPGLAAAIDGLYDLYADELYRYARFTLRDVHLAEDVVQEVFIRAIRAWDSFRGDAAPRTWLWQIARNYMRDVLRRKEVRRRHSVSDPVELYDVGAPFESLLELEDQLAGLTDHQRQVFILRCMQDLSVKDTAEVLGWTESKVKTTLSRALTKLRTQFEQEPGFAKDAGLTKGTGFVKDTGFTTGTVLAKDTGFTTDTVLTEDTSFIKDAGLTNEPDKESLHKGGGPNGMERTERQI
ncbi:RNA polymerase sigma factor [Alicyclobacillus curvatus]|nr:RNA polymerase sigma factor [Alicyclobacillus curvatus]